MAKRTLKADASQSARKANAFPYLGTPLNERLKHSNNVDLTNNHKITDKGAGYWEIRPLDASL
ncbi:hypothetical protein [Hymenobacter convexus]|uniref:hypothetical protein n=1 Tax=Hymenobacter sp. CA1UV-4 TaxID=3063782 RepID=UPI0027122642|nr:hypothetical protein [Hymenobacter sp. CA1UV-4]MDO7850390.1 hypothetical protein [Hymenobacter sp. CA1UV-4]